MEKTIAPLTVGQAGQIGDSQFKRFDTGGVGGADAAVGEIDPAALHGDAFHP